MDTSATDQQAIKLALEGDWEGAIALNLSILKKNSKDTDALNRLARAYSEIGKYKLARKYASQVTKIDPANLIATKLLKRWKGVGDMQNVQVQQPLVDSFIEEPGKTKLVTLLNPGDQKTIDKLDCGEAVEILSHSHKVSVVNSEKKYIGKLPDDISMRLRTLIKSGFKYSSIIKSIDDREVKVFMREIQRPEKKNDVVSFPLEKIEYISYTPPELVHKDEKLQMGEEENSQD